MLERWVGAVGAVLVVAACEAPASFTPPPASYTTMEATIEGASGPQTIASIDSTFFGPVQPLLGRRIMPTEYGDGTPVTILSHGFWAEQFESRPDVIGSKVSVDGVPRTVVGIMPQGVDVPPDVALWIPRGNG